MSLTIEIGVSSGKLLMPLTAEISIFPQKLQKPLTDEMERVYSYRNEVISTLADFVHIFLTLLLGPSVSSVNGFSSV